MTFRHIAQFKDLNLDPFFWLLTLLDVRLYSVCTSCEHFLMGCRTMRLIRHHTQQLDRCVTLEPLTCPSPAAKCASDEILAFKTIEYNNAKEIQRIRHQSSATSGHQSLQCRAAQLGSSCKEGSQKATYHLLDYRDQGTNQKLKDRITHM